MKKLQYQRYTPNGLQMSRAITTSTRYILAQAEKLGVKWAEIPGTEILKLTFQNHTEYFHQQVPPGTSALGHYSCNDKNVTVRLLEHAGLCVPHGFRVRRKDDAATKGAIFESLRKPVAVKPTGGSGGDAISLNIRTQEEYETALNQALDSSLVPQQGAIVEEMFAGKEYRILVTRERVIGITHRIPANITGDGHHTVAELIVQKNADPRRGQSFEQGTPLIKLKKDADMKQILEKQGLSFESVPKKGEQIFLRAVSNLSRGGDSLDYTDLAHPTVHELALRAIRAIPGVALAGVDFMTTDITSEQSDDTYVIIEINDSPGIFMHDQPYEGENRGAAREFVYLLFPELRPQ